MSICNSCGGVIGVDCFNPKECEEISYSMERQETESLREEIYYKDCEINSLKEQLSEFRKDLEILRKYIISIDERTRGLMSFGPIK